ncbi:hypothetical protein B0O99DRAFT_693055 [Bisporella sp. PMI_857]|nr:hypothetical protein B0O99DRAFT_693055 [Bisporella sp. PMI_857]
MNTPPKPNSVFSQRPPSPKINENSVSEQLDPLDAWKQEGKEFDTNVKSIVNPILDMLRSEAVDIDTNKETNKDKVAKFLQRQDCDDCVAWMILYHSLDYKSKYREENAEERVNLCELILLKRPYLAFEEPSAFRSICNLKEIHWNFPLNETPPTPFWKAARMGNAKVIRRMISYGRDFCKDPAGNKIERLSSLTPEKGTTDSGKLIQDLVWKPWKEFRSDRGKTALKIAALSPDAGTDKGRIETLDVLLKVPGIADADDDTFAWALDEGKEKVVEKFLGADCAKLFVKSKYIIQAMENYFESMTKDHSSHQGNADRVPEYKILQSLIEKAEIPDADKIEIAETMIKRDLKDIWDERATQWDKLLKTDGLLHLAVLHQKLSFVDTFLKSYPGSVLSPVALRKHMGDKAEHYPLWYNNKQWDKASSKFIDRKDTASKDIRTAIVRSTVRQEKDMQELMRILQASGEPVHELFFDISEFVQSLIQHRDPKKPVLPLYEETIRYAEFPALDLKVEDRESFNHNNHFTVPHVEVFDVLNWLHDDKGVRSIIELKVQDRLINPHDEIRIAQNVKRFNVEVLDWKILDLSISIFEKEVKERIKELHLYSSGKRAETMTAAGYEATRKDVEAGLKKLADESKSSWTKKPTWEVKPRFWNSPPGQVNLDEIAQKLAPKLAVFLHDLKGLERNLGNFRRTKVAIIDNGILGITPRSSYNKPIDAGGERQLNDDRSLLSRVKDGCSFVDDHSKLGSWLFASDPHGTQMANLICAIDPLCDLYVAKVTEDKSGITNDRVARAVEWAISKDVDVISMSFALLEKSTKLKTQVEYAGLTKRIVMACSTHDQGERITEAWPASFKASIPLMIITACDEYGRILRQSSLPEPDYMIQGQKVWAGDIPFLDSRESPTGSSVSTAIAAGLSSLILTCDRMANRNRELPNEERYARVEHFLKKK